MSSWTKLVDPLINMAKKRKILTAVDEGNLKFAHQDKVLSEDYLSHDKLLVLLIEPLFLEENSSEIECQDDNHRMKVTIQ